jgi:hypothetical protein
MLCWVGLAAGEGGEGVAGGEYPRLHHANAAVFAARSASSQQLQQLSGVGPSSGSSSSSGSGGSDSPTAARRERDSSGRRSPRAASTKRS